LAAMPAKFSIQQTVLLLKLKQTGLTCEQVVRGLNELDDEPINTIFSPTSSNRPSNTGAKREATATISSPKSAKRSCPNNPQRQSAYAQPGTTAASSTGATSYEVVQLMKRNIVVVRDEIQAFMTRNNLCQADISKATENHLKSSYLSYWFQAPKHGTYRLITRLLQWYVDEVAKLEGSSTQQLYDTDENPPIEASSSVWPSQCEAYLSDIIKKNAEGLIATPSWSEICMACTSLIREYYLSCGILSSEEVTKSQLVAYLDTNERTSCMELPAHNNNMSSSSSNNNNHSYYDEDVCGESAGASALSSFQPIQQQQQLQQYSSVSDKEIDELMTMSVEDVRNKILSFMKRSGITQKSVQENVDFSSKWLSSWLLRPTANSKHIRSLYYWYLSMKKKN